jgi:hypothetical protein
MLLFAIVLPVVVAIPALEPALGAVRMLAPVAKVAGPAAAVAGAVYTRAPLCIATSTLAAGAAFTPLPVWFQYPVCAAANFVCGVPVTGFTSEGVRITSIASRLQSLIGDVPKGGWFAFMQSLGTKLR